jgi:flagellar biosynthesis protein FlhB
LSEPSPERIRRARARGQVAASQRLTAAASLACGLALVAVTARATRDAFAAGLDVAVRAAATNTPPPVARTLGHALSAGLRATAPTLAATTLALALAHALQTRFLVAWPDDDAPRADPAGALAAAAWALALALTAALAAWSLAPALGLAGRAHGDVLHTLTALLTGVAWRVLAVAAALGALELLWRRARYLASLRPTRAEALREAREAEGSPHARTECARQARGLP